MMIKKIQIKRTLYLILFTIAWVFLLALFQEFYKNWQGHTIRSIYIMTATLPVYGYIAHRILLIIDKAIEVKNYRYGKIKNLRAIKK